MNRNYRAILRMTYNIVIETLVKRTLDRGSWLNDRRTHSCQHQRTKKRDREDEKA